MQKPVIGAKAVAAHLRWNTLAGAGPARDAVTCLALDYVEYAAVAGDLWCSAIIHAMQTVIAAHPGFDDADAQEIVNLELAACQQAAVPRPVTNRKAPGHG